jgi:hypothetical protein
MEKNIGIAHDRMDAIVATLIGWCRSHFSKSQEPVGDIAFSDEWERKQIARELHWDN